MDTNLIKIAPLFAGLTSEEEAALNKGFVRGQASNQQVILESGTRSDGLYLLESGFVSLTTAGGQTLATLTPPSILGEASLFGDAALDVNAVAYSDVEYLKLSDQKLREIILQHPAIGIKLSRNFGKLIAQMEDYLVQKLAKTPELASLPKHTLEAVANHLQPKEFPVNQPLFRHGEMPGGLYLVEDGLVELRPESDAYGDEPQTLQSGALFGALALLTNKPYSQSALALQETLLWVLPIDSFQTVNSQHPGLRRSLGRNVRARLNKTDQAEAGMRLAHMPLFNEVPPQTMQAISQRMVLQHVPAGERVYLIGEAGDALYLVEQGEIELTAENASGVVEELARVADSGFFGEMSLLTGQIRTEDATATRNADLWVLYKSDLDELSVQHPAIGKALSQGLATRLTMETQDHSAERFREFQLFTDLDPAELKQISEHLRPTRYRAGEQIFRASAPAEMLFLLEKGEIRIQPITGGSWLLGPGESFGERALLNNQPHNATVIAETDVDLWTLSKNDFDMLLHRYPSLAINMSRLLSQRWSQAAALSQQPEPGYQQAGVPVEYAPSATTTATQIPAPRRRHENAFEEPVAPPRERLGFGDWFGQLSGMAKLRFALLILLLIWLLTIAAPAALLALMQGVNVTKSAAMALSSNALQAVYAVGSYELAQQDQASAMAVAMADRAVGATATYTPYPTATPIPTNTPLPTNTPTVTPLPTATLPPVFRSVVPQAPAPPPEEEVVRAAIAAPVRIVDPRINQLGVNIDDAQVPPGQPYWRLKEVRWQNEAEAGGKHHIYVEVLDESGSRIVGHPVTVFWGGDSHTGATENKNPPDYSFNYQMYAAGYAYNVKVEGLPSDILRGAGLGSINKRTYGIHVAYYLTYQRETKY